MNRSTFAACLAAACAVVCAGAIAAEPAAQAEAAFLTDSKVTLQLRTYYFDRLKPDDTVSAAWAGGGWLTYESGWLADVFGVGLTGYTSQPIWAPDDKDGTLLLKPGQDGYTVLGQAYGALKLGDHVFKGYRQLVNQPEVNPHDVRMTPNTFEGYTLGGKLAGVDYFGGYLAKMKTKNSDTFRDMASVAGTPSGVSEGLWLGGLTWTARKDLSLRLSAYHVPNILTSGYADASWVAALSEEWRLRLGAQYMAQSSAGDDLLTGSSFDTWSAGAKVDVTRGRGGSLSVVYNQTGRGQAYRTPYGGWAGYTSMIVKDFNRAGEKTWLLGFTYDFARSGAPGLFFNAAAVRGTDAVDAATGAALSKNTEYDATLDYRFSDKRWPEWARPLWLRARAARVEEKLGDTKGITEDYRIIVNYEWKLK